MREITILLIFFLFHCSGFSQRVPQFFFSQNGWMTDTLGNVLNCGGDRYGIPCHVAGNLHSVWPLVRESGAKLIRFGGETADENKPTMRQYLRFVDSCRRHGLEPMLQVPYNNNYYTADTAAEIVRYINVYKKRNVKYWCIGNEPDLRPPLGYGYISASPIADYIRLFATRMKEVDSTILTLGPELKFCNNTNEMINDLTSPGGFYDITGKVPGKNYYYLDILTFHYYPFNGSQTREQVIENLRKDYQLEHVLITMKQRIDSCNAFHQRNASPLKLAVTEANINYRNSTDSTKADVNAKSFLAGQFWIDMASVALKHDVQFISFWSIVEESLGYIDPEDFSLRPTWHHYKLMADHVRGRYLKHEFQNAEKELKVLAARDEELITILLMNQKSKGGQIRFGLYGGEGKVQFKKRVNVKIADLQMQDTLLLYADSIPDESTMLLQITTSGQVVKKLLYQKGFKEPAPMIPAQAVILSAGPDRTIRKNDHLTLTMNGNGRKNVKYYWYEEDSTTPINSKPMASLRITPGKSTRYRVVAAMEGCEAEHCVSVKVEE